jgi:SAM-dependent methyltransferase
MKKHIHHPPKKLTRKQKDDLLANHLPGLLTYHQTMLSDGVRNKILYEAIRQNVNQETNFLDIGAGTGVWAILAAKLGAKRVVAIEIEEALIPIIFKHAQENGVAHQIEIIHGNSDHVKLRGKFDVIVSELFGGDALGETTTKSFVSLRNRFLAPNGVLIPQKLTMLAAPIRLEKSVQNIPADLPLNCSFIKSIKLNYGRSLSIEEREKIEFLAEPQKLVEIEFRTVETHPNLNNLSVAWKMDNLAQANAIAVFNNSTFTDELVMNSFYSQSWGATTYEFQPFETNSGELRFTMTMDGPKSIWAVQEVASNKMQNYSPTFAPARIKMAQQMSFYRKVRPPKPEAVKSKKSKGKSLESV